tara:strand:- start:472 stop:2193 length:1722 start_codon:yes stop_codon:yes gene_type:complete
MTTRSMENQSDFSFIARTDDEIDLRQVYGALRRRKSLIARITAATVLISGIYALTSKPVWQGQFEIVLANAQSPSSQASSLSQSNPGLANLIGAGSGNNKLETEVEILESPSVLKPVFDFVKQQKQQQGSDTQDLRYSDWVENLTVELVKGTSVLELAYRDTDKDLVLPIIQKISDAYQDYSGRDRERGINKAIQYLDQQIKIYNQKSVRSLRTAQEYGIEQDLTALQGDGTDDAEIKNSINVEAIRIAASNQIRNINEQLKQLDQLDNSPETLMYIGRNIPELASQGIPQTLDEMDASLALLRAKYTDQDESIRRLLEKRRLLVDVFKRQTYGYLYAQRSAAQARLKAAERPKGVLIKYRELLRTAARDEATLTKLESERQILALEQARKEDPWELISNPTLLDSPVAPRKKRTVALGLLAGLVAGSGAALLVDRRTGLVYSEDELNSLMPCALIKHLPATNGSAWTDAADLLAEGPLAQSPENSAIALIPVGDIPNEQLQTFSAELRRALGGRELIVSTDLRQTSRCSTQLLLTSQGAATRIQLSQLRQKLALQGTPLAGWVLLDPDLNLG